MSEDVLSEDRHAAKMAKKKAARDKLMAGKTVERGLLVVHTGPGKGKTTAALGMALRCVGHGFKVAIIQFIKGAMDSAERRALAAFGDLVSVQALGEGFTWETQDREKDEAAVRAAWAEAKKHLSDPLIRMVILDELNIALRYAYMPLEDVLEALAARPDGQHVVITGRGAPEELIARADLVTEMSLIKHPFRSGVKAQAGVEF
ncbi:MAG: cob(I)yrinic acid a,c-diamide adenosyltransferase [Alphaproteobacteria bacterium RIFOXYD12_FULL_60_8]|nr:MAG: cob(I)yrinic acid a,c-diamide adenosyltransferase [Alphaproteobacteria bacterium RIFOXYD12_FULL_60_8]